MANRQLSLRERTKSALERITQLEDNHDSLVKGVTNELHKTVNRLNVLEETMGAVTKSIGLEVILAIMEDSRREKQTAQADAAKAEIASLVEQKVLVPVDVVGEDSFIVGHDVDENGEIVHPGFGHTHFKAVEPKLQEKVKGGKAGLSILTGKTPDSKSAFVVDQIYTFVASKAPEAPVVEAATLDAAAMAEADAEPCDEGTPAN